MDTISTTAVRLAMHTRFTVRTPPLNSTGTALVHTYFMDSADVGSRLSKGHAIVQSLFLPSVARRVARVPAGLPQPDSICSIRPTYCTPLPPFPLQPKQVEEFMCAHSPPPNDQNPPLPPPELPRVVFRYRRLFHHHVAFCVVSRA